MAFPRRLTSGVTVRSSFATHIITAFCFLGVIIFWVIFRCARRRWIVFRGTFSRDFVECFRMLILTILHKPFDCHGSFCGAFGYIVHADQVFGCGDCCERTRCGAVGYVAERYVVAVTAVVVLYRFHVPRLSPKRRGVQAACMYAAQRPALNRH